jgi:FMN-dependent NADH-azoreductase
MMGQAVDPAEVPSWGRIEELIDQFRSADAYLLTSPMWNFGLPYTLKHWIDCIIQPGYTFAYTDGYPVPLILGRRMVCITSRGADYSPTGPMGAYDFQEPYLRAIFGFIGVTDIEFIHAQPMDHPLLQEATIATALGAIDELAGRPHWSQAATQVETRDPAST